MILELKGIYKEYQQGKMKVPVLKNVDFSDGRGRICLQSWDRPVREKLL